MKTVKEIEKKYLISENEVDYSTELFKQIYPTIDAIKKDIKNGKKVNQGYLPIKIGKGVCEKISVSFDFAMAEARLRDQEGNYFFTIKSEGSLKRDELNIPISKEIFETYWPKTKGKRVEKIHITQPYKVNGLEYLLELNVYTDRNLIVAEIEVESKEEAEKLPMLGLDVTLEKKYKNKNLAK